MRTKEAQARPTKVALMAHGDTVVMRAHSSNMIPTVRLTSGRKQTPLATLCPDVAATGRMFAQCLRKSRNEGWNLFYVGPQLRG